MILLSQSNNSNLAKKLQKRWFNRLFNMLSNWECEKYCYSPFYNLYHFSNDTRYKGIFALVQNFLPCIQKCCTRAKNILNFNILISRYVNPWNLSWIWDIKIKISWIKIIWILISWNKTIWIKTILE